MRYVGSSVCTEDGLGAATSRHGPAKPLAAKDDDHQSIIWAHAYGQFVVVTSDAEKLEAHGNDLVYDARTKGNTLKGTPEMVAVKEGHEIHAPELIMYGAEAQRDGGRKPTGPATSASWTAPGQSEPSRPGGGT